MNTKELDVEFYDPVIEKVELDDDGELAITVNISTRADTMYIFIKPEELDNLMAKYKEARLSMLLLTGGM